MRSKTVTVNGKQVAIKEYKIRELREEVIPKLGSLFNIGALLSTNAPELPLPGENEALTTEAVDEAVPAEEAPKRLLNLNITEIIPIVEDKLIEFFPALTQADIEESYPSEIEGLVEAWIAVNFTGLKKIFQPLLSLAKLGMAK